MLLLLLMLLMLRARLGLVLGADAALVVLFLLAELGQEILPAMELVAVGDDLPERVRPRNLATKTQLHNFFFG